MKIPRSCLNQAKRDSNLFSVVLSPSFTCPIMWKPLNVCRKYKLEMKSKYSDTWSGPPSSWEIFTVQQGWEWNVIIIIYRPIIIDVNLVYVGYNRFLFSYKEHSMG